MFHVTHVVSSNQMISSLFQLSLHSCVKYIENDLYSNLKFQKEKNNEIYKYNKFNKLKTIPVYLLKLILSKFEPFYLDLIDDCNLNISTNILWKSYLIKFKKYFNNLIPLNFLLKCKFSDDNLIDYKKHYFEILKFKSY